MPRLNQLWQQGRAVQANADRITWERQQAKWEVLKRARRLPLVEAAGLAWPVKVRPERLR
jgi:hypothetical protein